jgi:hypothetical protein
MAEVNDIAAIPKSADKSSVVEFVDEFFVVLLTRKSGVVLLIGLDFISNRVAKRVAFLNIGAIKFY